MTRGAIETTPKMTAKTHYWKGLKPKMTETIATIPRMKVTIRYWRCSTHRTETTMGTTGN